MTIIEASKITEHMEVIPADGEKIGKVDHMQDGLIKLTKTDSPDHHHHLVPLSWVDHIDAHVHLNKTLADIKAATTGGKTGASEVEAVPNPSSQPSGPGKGGGSEAEAVPNPSPS